MVAPLTLCAKISKAARSLPMPACCALTRRYASEIRLDFQPSELHFSIPLISDHSYLNRSTKSSNFGYDQRLGDLYFTLRLQELENPWSLKLGSTDFVGLLILYQSRTHLAKTPCLYVIIVTLTSTFLQYI